MLGWLALQADPTLLRLGLAAEEEDVTRLVSSPPQLPQPAKLYRLSDEVLSKCVGRSYVLGRPCRRCTTRLHSTLLYWSVGSAVG